MPTSNKSNLFAKHTAYNCGITWFISGNKLKNTANTAPFRLIMYQLRTEQLLFIIANLGHESEYGL
jgi:hypothetical protein